jgi:pyruvate, orthophosphate dikinase
MTKRVYSFAEGNASMKSLLGGKGANLAEMTKIGLPVPPGFTITTEACKVFNEGEMKLPDGLVDEIKEHLSALEKKTGKKFGSSSNPLLLSVRSGAPISMPGMMDTILNLGLNTKSVKGMITKTKNPRFVYDNYRRLIQMFGDVVLGVEHHYFESAIAARKKKMGVSLDIDLDDKDLKELCATFKNLVKKHAKRDFPEDPMEQLFMAVEAVFSSWSNQRAIDYRKLNDIPNDLFTAVNIQTMVFGNMGSTSLTGVGFTRDPGTGAKELYGEYLVNAQGEDVVAGIRTPKHLDKLKDEFPKQYLEFARICRVLERHYKEMQDLEFTVEEEVFYILQTRTGKRTGKAAVKIAVDMVREGLIITDDAIMRVDADAVEQLLHPEIDPKAVREHTPISEGLPASPGAASGIVVFGVQDAIDREAEGIILTRVETTPEDIRGMAASVGVLTTRGGKTSHAAVVARGMGKPAVTGMENGTVYYDKKELRFDDGTVIKEGDIVTIDGGTGKVYLGRMPTIEAEFTEELEILLSWADSIRRLGVRANADTPKMADRALKFGASGIGLCRTERMFNFEGRLEIVVEMILAKDKKNRLKALKKLGPMQRQDFIDIFRIMKDYPITVRLLDVPLHEFLPPAEDLIREVMELKQSGVSQKKINERQLILDRVNELKEVNPMLGHRGVRLGMSYPEIYEMQVRGIFEAVAYLKQHEGISIIPEIMIPQVSTAQEVKWVKGRIEDVRLEVEKRESSPEIKYRFGTMIEVVRACMRAGRIAEEVDFFSFGTNDLTQATFSFSREDAENKFLPLYEKRKTLQDNPFGVLDVKGVGRLMMITVEYGRKTKPGLKIGICGEHGGEPRSIDFCHEIGLDYVSCSPFRVPVARLAAAQAALRRKK